MDRQNEANRTYGVSEKSKIRRREKRKRAQKTVLNGRSLKVNENERPPSGELIWT